MTKTLSNILRGMGSVLEIWPPERHFDLELPTEGRSDREAIAGDWRNVGRDLSKVINATETAEDTEERGEAKSFS